MTIARTISIGAVVMFALSAALDPVYAAGPCCALKNGAWIVTKTGKPASPAQVRTMEKSQAPASIKAASPKTGGATGSSNPAPVGGSAEHGGGGGGHK
jgi:hypothetical protein